ncbi:hypothetical protein EDD37DRAFT_646914 [Exophiala viscosa]|uniref:SET domain-containing protein n=1 Tax=Exophiala viscosa TaxID=2486360 RepID=A0AAN6IK18_9EURO|nr:hypothetical protein EDD36DRAFT_22182 [Exophiala viscosa]KAI1627228.1 hypothetical protein EDD37DRAFT_646914 [Exophiala viscosa]
MDGCWVRPWVGSLCHYGDESQSLIEQYLSHYPHYQEPNQTELPQVELQLRSISRRIHHNPYLIETRIARAELLIKLRFPELAVSDAHKALLLTCRATQDTWPGRSCYDLYILKRETSLLLGQALFLARCFVECLDLLLGISQQNYVLYGPKKEDYDTLTKSTRRALRLERQHHWQDNSFREAEKEYQDELLSKGEIKLVPYPWIPDLLFRRTMSTIEDAKSELQRLSNGRVTIEETQLRERLQHGGQLTLDQDAYGLFAMADIAAGSKLFVDRTVICANSGSSRCPACCADLTGNRSTFWASEELFCDAACAGRLNAVCQLGALYQWSGYYQRTHSRLSQPPKDEDQALFFRVLAAVHKHTRDHSSGHPLESWPINRLTAGYHSGATRAWSYTDDVCAPLEVLEKLGGDIFEDSLSEGWVLETISNRIATNARGLESNEDQIAAINPLYSFFNHSCRPNVAALDDEMNGTSSVRIVARKDIARGSELFISYLSNEELRTSYENRKQLLSAWTGGDCQCMRCAHRRERPDSNAACVQEEPECDDSNKAIANDSEEEEEAVMTNSEDSDDESDETSMEF